MGAPPVYFTLTLGDNSTTPGAGGGGSAPATLDAAHRLVARLEVQVLVFAARGALRLDDLVLAR